MRGFMKFAWMPLIALSVSATTLNISTGSTSGAAFVGGGWLVNSAAAVTLGPTGLPLINTTPAFAGFGWTGNAGEWIASAANDGGYINGGVCSTGLSTATCGALPGSFVYTLTWTSTFGGSFSIAGFTGDNGVKNGSPINTSLIVTINSATIFNGSSGSQNAMATCVPTGNPSPNECAASADHLINNGSGVITYSAGQTIQIRALVVNNGLNAADTTTRTPTGFILRGTGNENNQIPEPSTYAMLGIGGAAMLIARLRRK